MRDERPLKPSVLDKLIAPLARIKGDGSRDVAPCHIAAVDTFSERDLKAVVIRDIAWIINDVCFSAAVPLEDYPEIATSVLNQGVPDLTALQVAKSSLQRRAQDIASALQAFEPRLVSSSIKVLFDNSNIDNENKVRFTILGELKGAIDERHIELKTAVTLDSGEVEVSA